MLGKIDLKILSQFSNFYSDRFETQKSRFFLQNKEENKNFF